MTSRFLTRPAFAVLVLLFLAFALIGQSPASVLKNAEKAMGGAKLLAAFRGWTRSGTITNLATGMKGKFVSHAAQPNLLHSVYDLGIEFESGFNGKSGWTRDSRDGLRTLTGDASLVMQAEAAFRNAYWFNYKKDKAKIISGGAGTVEGKPASIVRLNTVKGVEFRLFFDQATGLLMREEIRSGAETAAFLYDDFRNTNGSKLPYRIRVEKSGETLAVEFDEIKPDANIAATVFDFPKVSGEPLPDIAKLLTELQSNEDEVEKLLDQYSFTQRSTRRASDKNGVLKDGESETWQLSFYKGNRIRRLIEKNGKPLTPAEQKDADREAQRQVEEIEKELAKKEKRGDSERPSEESRRISVAEVLRASRLLNPRRECFRGRDVIVFDFEPNPEFDYKNAKSMLKLFGKMAGVMWIDEKDKQVARLEAYLADSFNIGGGVLAKLKKGASFTMEQERLNDEIWLPSLAVINLSVRVLMVKGIDVNQEIRSFDYRKFSTEVKDAKVGEPVKN